MARPTKIENGKVVPITDDEWTEKQIRETEFNSLGSVKARRKAEVRGMRKQAETSGIAVSGLTIPTDDKTQSRVDQIVKAYEDGDITGTIDFELPTGSFVALDQTQMQAIKAAGAQHIQACFSRQKTLVEAIDAASDHAAVTAIDITTGWPV